MKRFGFIFILLLAFVAPFLSCADDVTHVQSTPVTQPTYDKFVDVVPPFGGQQITSSSNWGLEAIKLDQAVKISKATRKIIVAVIDTGIDPEHQSIKSNLWTSPENDSFGEHKDNVGHGTHVSGIITSIYNNVSIMALKYSDFADTLRAIRYAIDHGADIINYSGGGKGYSAEEFTLFKEAESRGIILVAAAGNDGEDIGRDPYYPAAYGLTNIISVAAADHDGALIKESNYGAGVDIAAPGLDIFSSMPGNKYGLLSGTSQAAAFVSGAVALIKANSPELSVEEIKSTIINSARHNEKLQDKVKAHGILDVANALSSIQ
jgi:subtilisin family serine protease